MKLNTVAWNDHENDYFFPLSRKTHAVPLIVMDVKILLAPVIINDQ